MQTQGLSPKAQIDVEASSAEDDVPRPTTSADKLNKLAGDDAEDRGLYLAKPIATNPIGSDAPGPSNPSITARFVTPILPLGKHGQKHPPPAARHNMLLDQVMTQIELPPYHGPCSPLDVVTIEIIFGSIFEVF
jgi:hypothetical protein